MATTKGNIAQLWDASTGRLLHTLKGHTQLINDAEYSPNGRELVTVSSDHSGRIWDTRTGHVLHVLLGHFFAVNTGSFSPDGRWIVTTSQFTAGLWNARTGQLLFYLGRDTKPLTSGELQPERQLDPHRQRGRDRPRLPVRDLSAAVRAGGDGEGASPRVALAVDRRRGATRLVAPCEHEQKGMQLLSLLGVERREELVLQALGQCAELRQRALAVGCDPDDLPAPVVGIALALDERLLLELVEQADERAAVVAERVRDLRLRLGSAPLEQERGSRSGTG